MCEIFFLKDTMGDGLSREIIDELLKTADLSAGRNSDGFGAFNEEREVIKSAEKFDNSEHGEKIKQKFEGSEFLVLHLRLATDGSVCEENAHPFRCGDDMLVHNGIVRTEVINHKSKPDSYELLKETVMWRGDDETEDTVDAIETTMDQAGGSVSIFLYDENDDLYYFRDRKSFYFGMDLETGTILGATQKSRIESLLKGRRKLFDFFDVKQEPEAGHILQITDSGISKVGKFETYSRGTWGRANRNRRNGYSTYHSDKIDDEDKDNDWAEESYMKSQGMTYDEYKDRHMDEDEEKAEPHSLNSPDPYYHSEGELMEVNF